MAKRPLKIKPKASGAGAAPAKQGTFTWILLISLALAFGLMFLPTVIFIGFAMLPTLAAYLVDRNPVKYEWICVGGLNFAGASPFLISLWMGRHTLDAAVAQLTDVFTLAAIYGAAGAGWLMYVALPPMIGIFIQMKAQRRIASLKATQARLTQTWGPEVGRSKV